MTKERNNLISIIICTHNRAEVLKEALVSFSKMQGLEDVAHELIVVDNKSNDSTKMVVEKFSKIKTLRYLYEEELGLSHARNRGIRESSGEIIAFVDDDVLFTESWLVELKTGIHSWPDAVVYGGKAVAKWEEPKPSWFVDDGFFSMREMIAHFEPDIPEGYMNLFPYGCNAAFRRCTIEKMKFNGKLGRKGSLLLADEERDLLIQIKKMGGQFVYLPKAMVFHRVMRDRCERQYYLRWIQSQSKSLVHMWSKHKIITRLNMGSSLGSILSIITATIRILVDISLYRDKERFFSYRIGSMRWFYRIKEYKRYRSIRKSR